MAVQLLQFNLQETSLKYYKWAGPLAVGVAQSVWDMHSSQIGSIWTVGQCACGQVAEGQD